MEDLSLKISLKCCRTFEDFDTIMNQTWCKTDEDKIEYLKEMFDVSVVHATNNDIHSDYLAMANAIMNYT